MVSTARAQSSLAKHIYEAVDRRIIQTDADIRRFEADLDKERKKYGLQSSKVNLGILGGQMGSALCYFETMLQALWRSLAMCAPHEARLGTRNAAQKNMRRFLTISEHTTDMT